MVDGKGGKILVVEDDAGVARLEQKQLQRAGYSVVCAGTAEEALSQLKHHSLDLILLDYVLPGEVTGLHLYKQMLDLGRVHRQEDRRASLQGTVTRRTGGGPPNSPGQGRMGRGTAPGNQRRQGARRREPVDFAP